MRIGCLQFAPQVGDVNNNLNRADAVLSKAAPEDLDLLVLPELAFTGYNFKSLQEITPFLEHSGSGITSLWARTIALKYDCTVTVGYPEKVDVSPKWPTGPEYYNSAIVVNGDGETIANYRKSFLYYTDESWALEGSGFYNSWIPGLGNTAIGICMDLKYEHFFMPQVWFICAYSLLHNSPRKFEAPWHAFEFAFHILEMQANLVIVSMAWNTREEPRQFSRMPNEPDLSTLTYWVARLEPLIRSENDDEIIVVFCNRTGIEGDATYAGTSAVIGIQSGEVKVYGILGRGQKELLVVDTNTTPYAKLVHRPEVPDADGVGNEPTAAPPSVKSPPSSDRLDVVDKLDTVKDPAQAQRTESPNALSDVQTESVGRSNQISSQISTPTDQSMSKLTPTESTSREHIPGDDQKEAGSQEPLLKQSPDSFTQRPHDSTNAATIPAEGNTSPEPTERTGHNNISSKGTSPKAPSPAVGNSSVPSASSFTPAAVRPKLIIPQGFPTAPRQLYPEASENPTSATSAVSENSIQSVKSDESEASTMTIRSNPRPPEDSTPYPYSGAPLSGYPANSFQKRRQIYGGSITIQTDPFTPVTVFDDASPMSTRSYWKPSNSATATPISAGGWWSTPFGRQPEPFPWTNIHSIDEAWGNESAQVEDLSSSAVSYTDLANDLQEIRTALPDAELAQQQFERSASAISLKSDAEESGVVPARPSSPKSRNASRSRNNERPTSAQGRLVSSGPPYRTESPAGFAASAASGRATPVKQAASIARPPSTKPMEILKSRPNVVRNVSSPESRSIPIIASPSILESQINRKVVVPTPVAVDYYRSAQSYTTTKGNSSLTAGRKDINSSMPTRTPSRGRKGGRECSPHTAEQTERSSSADSTRNDTLHHKVKRSSPESRGSNRRNISGHRKNDVVDENRNGNAAEFERVEDVVCPSCPVHGRRSSSTADTSSSLSRRNRACRHSRTSSQKVERSSDLRDKSTDAEETDYRHGVARSLAIAGNASSERQHYTKSPISRPVTAPSVVDPPTPEAMSLDECFRTFKSMDDHSIEHLDLTAGSKGGKKVLTQVMA